MKKQYKKVETDLYSFQGHFANVLERGLQSRKVKAVLFEGYHSCYKLIDAIRISTNLSCVSNKRHSFY